MFFNTSRLGRLAIPVVAAMLLIAACGDNGDGETETPDETTPATETQAPTETPEATETTDETGTPEGTNGETSGDATVSISEEGDLAPYLVGPDGMTLYLFTNDEPGVSNCNADCLANWPGLTLAE